MTKLDSFNLAVRFSVINLLNSGLVIHLLLLGILLSTSLIYVFKTLEVTKPLVSGVFLTTSPIFFAKFCLLVFYWFMYINVVASGIFF